MDAIFASFLRTQHDRVMELSEESDRLDVIALEGETSQHYLARFLCRTMIRGRDNTIRPEERAVAVGIALPNAYLLEVANPFAILTILEPTSIYHPQVRGHAICIGRIDPATPLTDLVYRVLEVITFYRVTPLEHDCLNPAACAWARQNSDLFPLDRRPLKRRVNCEFGSEHRTPNT